MPRPSQIVLRAALLTLCLVPCVAWADALPPDPDDVFYHCTPAEQCPSGSMTCAIVRGAAGRTTPDEDCAARAGGAGLEQRCAGRGGYLYCRKGASGSWAPPPPRAAASGAPRRGCR